MRLQLFAIALVSVCALFAGDGQDKDRIKKQGDATYSNDNVEIAATVLIDRVLVKDALGADLGAGYCVVKLTVTPKTEEKMRVDFDDFTLLSYKDGQRSQPFQPSQIAGNATMVVSTRTTSGGGMMGQDNGPIWGGIGGAPRRMPGNGGGIGNSSSEEEASASIEKNGTKGKSPLMVALEKQMFPSVETSEPVSGLLYFPLEGKQKAKDLGLLYKGPAGRFSMEFH